jgi:hypothetical protein
VFILFIMVGLTLVSDWLMYKYPLFAAADAVSSFELSLVKVKLMPTLVVWTAFFAVVTFGFGFAVNINKFSLFGMYRNRLIRSYL